MKQNREQRRKDAKAKARLNRELQIHSQMAFDAGADWRQATFSTVGQRGA